MKSSGFLHKEQKECFSATKGVKDKTFTTHKWIIECFLCLGLDKINTKRLVLIFLQIQMFDTSFITSTGIKATEDGE